MKRFLDWLKFPVIGPQKITDDNELREAYVEFFDSAQKSIYVVVCELEASAFKDRVVFKAIREALKRDRGTITIEILVGPDVPSIAAFESLEPLNNFTIHRLQGSPKKHVFVVDASDVLLIEQHVANEVRACALYNEGRFARRVLREIRESVEGGY